ncbi:NAD(P)-dependent oxidoreductase [Bacteroidota bacterium]
MNIAFLGTGLMGSPMALRLLNAGYKLIVYNRTKSKAISLESNGAVVADDSNQAVKGADVVIIMLSDYTAIKKVLFAENKITFKGKTIIQMSTISPVESVMLKKRIEKAGGDYMEAPVLGSIPQVNDGSLFVLFGGSQKQYDKWSHLLKNFGKEVTLVGDVGDASATKLALNQLIASLTAAFSMSLGYLREKDVKLEAFMEILRKSALYAPTFDKKLSNMMDRNFENPNFPLKHLMKDVDLIVSEFESQKINSAPLSGLKKILKKSLDSKMDELDYSAVYNTIHPEK